MWIPKEVVPYLIDTVRDLIARVESDPDDPTDPNDFLIFQMFVLPVLEDARKSGFDRREMLSKGFGFLIGMIPPLLNRRRAEMDRAHFGILARLFHQYMIEQVLHYIEILPENCYEENLPGINQRIDFVRIPLN